MRARKKIFWDVDTQYALLEPEGRVALQAWLSLAYGCYGHYCCCGCCYAEDEE